MVSTSTSLSQVSLWMTVNGEKHVRTPTTLEATTGGSYISLGMLLFNTYSAIFSIVDFPE